MFFNSEIVEVTHDLLNVSLIPPKLKRQNACENLLELNNLEVDIKDNLFKSIPDLTSNYVINSPFLKRHNSETFSTIKTTELKRIKTF